MMYVDFTAGNKEYKLRLNTRAVLALEKQLGYNPVSIFGKGDTIPTITAMVTVLHASLQQLQHNITFDAAADIFDEYLEDGHSMTDFIPVILDIYRASGIVSGNTEKN